MLGILYGGRFGGGSQDDIYHEPDMAPSYVARWVSWLRVVGHSNTGHVWRCPPTLELLGFPASWPSSHRNLP